MLFLPFPALLRWYLWPKRKYITSKRRKNKQVWLPLSTLNDSYFVFEFSSYFLQSTFLGLIESVKIKHSWKKAYFIGECFILIITSWWRHQTGLLNCKTMNAVWLFSIYGNKWKAKFRSLEGLLLSELVYLRKYAQFPKGWIKKWDDIIP